MLSSPSRFMTVFVTKGIKKSGMDILNKHFKDIILPSSPNEISRKEFVEKALKADIILADRRDVINKEILDSPKLKLVSVCAAGYDNIDLKYATKRKIVVANTHSQANTCADTIFTLILACARRVVECDQFVRSGTWGKVRASTMFGLDIHHKTLGIIGAGKIGKCVAERGEGFKMKILYNDIGPGFTPLDNLLKESDVVVLATPLTEKTRKLIGKREIGLMKPTAILANIGRGACIDTEALADALEQKKIWGAALDVIDQEPIPANHRILKNKNLAIFPHIGSGSNECHDEMAREAAMAAVYFMHGENVPNITNKELYE